MNFTLIEADDFTVEIELVENDTLDAIQGLVAHCMILEDDRILFIESESVPESHIEPIVEFHPSHILIVDAAILGLSPGAIELRTPPETTHVAISTHSLPIHIFCSYLKRVTRAQIGLLLIQPQKTSFGEGLSPQVKRAAKEVVKTFHQLLT